MHAPGDPQQRLRQCFLTLTLISGLAALSWQVIWQLKSSLALGVSAWGTALTLATTMGGMCIGSLLMGWYLKDRLLKRPVALYGALEIMIGLCALGLTYAFQAVETLDTWTYQNAPDHASLVHIIGIITAIGLPTICMGATLPVLGLAARQFNTTLSGLYGLNTLGAAIGALLCAFLLIPAFGIEHSIYLIAALNLAVGLFAILLSPTALTMATATTTTSHIEKPLLPALIIVFVTGFATFALEVAWFRSLTAAFNSTTDAFAIMVASVLAALGISPYLLPLLRMKQISLGTILSLAGILVFVATPVIERFDVIIPSFATSSPLTLRLNWFLVSVFAIGLPVLMLGVALPWILDDQKTSRRWSQLYALNTCAAILGSLCAAWLLLPTLGFARTAWLAAIMLLVTGLIFSPAQRRLVIGSASVFAFLFAFTFETGAGRTRALGWDVFRAIKPERLLASYEGPDTTASVVEYAGGMRVLMIDGFAATLQSYSEGNRQPEHYLKWMGHLPMALHSAPKTALVICFGTGQTANAVRNEQPEKLDIVDINANVFKLAPFFNANEQVLDDSRVHATVMDGRSYMRRTSTLYDVITLEPMPPTFAGVNALYSKEFYQSAHDKMNDGGIIAQWVPFHLISVYSSTSIAKTFQSVFPNAVLWIDPPSQTGILIGSKDGKDLGKNWPGFDKRTIKRDMAKREVEAALQLNSQALEKYAAHGDIITDDNQLLAYGRAAYEWRSMTLDQENKDFLKTIK